MEPEAYSHEAVDLAVLDSSYQLYYRGEIIQAHAADDLLDCPNIHPTHIYAELKDDPKNVDTEDDKAQYSVSRDVYWGKA